MKVKSVGASDEQISWGSNDDPRDILDEGTIYEVDRKEVHTWHTKYYLKGEEVHTWHTKSYLKGIEGAFNSVCFEIVEDIDVDTSDSPEK